MPKPQDTGSYYTAQTFRLSGVGFMVFEKDDAILSVVQILGYDLEVLILFKFT